MRKTYKKSSISEDIPHFMYEKIKKTKSDQLVDFKSFNKIRLVFFYLSAFFLLTIIPDISFGQISYSTAGSNYTQNFDNLYTTVPANNTAVAPTTLPAGWIFTEAGSNANTTIRNDNGSSGTGDSYLDGATLSNERSLGSYASGSLTCQFGAFFTNNTGTTLTQFTLSYTGEQWKDGGSSTAVLNTLSFAYSINPASLTSGTYTNATALDFLALVNNTSSDVTLDGNISTNQRAVSATVTGVSWAPGQTLYLRWTDINDPGNDDNLAIDGLTFSASNGTTPLITVGGLTPSGSFSTTTGTTSAVKTFTLSGANLTANLTVSAVSGYEYSDDGFTTAGQNSLTYSTASVSKTISVRLTGASAGTFNGTINIASTGATGSPSTISLAGSVTTQPTITEVLLPQYIQGNSSTNSNRIPYACLLTLTNLTANATYNYFPAVVISTDAASSNGAGNCIFPSSSGFGRSSGGSLSSAGNFGSFTANSSGSYTGWFILEPTGNTRFVPGTVVFIRLNMNDGAGGTSVIYRPTTTNSATVINLVGSAGASNGTALRGNSSALAKNFVVAYDNISGSGRPIAATFVESDGTANTTANSYASFYSASVEGIAGAYGVIVPNINSNGIKRIEQHDLTTGTLVGCASTDADGIWPGGANTINPTGGATALVITSTDAPLNPNTSVGGNVSSNAAGCYGANSGTLTLSGQTGSILKWQYSNNNFAGDVHDFANTTSSQSYSNLTQTTYYRAVVQSGACPSANSSVAVITVTPQVTVSCPANINANVTSGICSASVSFAATATGVSPVLAYKIGASPISSPYTFSLGATTVTATATDSCGGVQSCSFTVTVTDNENPTIAAPADVTMNITTGCTASGVVLGSAVTDDNCSIASVTNNAPANFNIGVTTVIWTVTDGSGNTATASQTVTITTTGADYWNGNVSNDWFDAANWCAGIPTAATDVQIPSGVLNMPVINNSGALCRNLNINSGAALSIVTNGSINIKGDWNNNGIFTSTGGAVIFDGTIVQSINGSSSFYEMDLNNTSGINLGTGSNVTITNILQLINGTITTNANVVTVDDTSAVVVTNGYVNGFLKKYIGTGSSVFQTFEVGSATDYTPVNFNFNTVFAGGYLTVNTISADHPSLATSGFNSSRTVNRYWNVVNSGLSFDSYDADLNFSASDEDAGFVEMYAGAKIYTTSGTWSMISSGASGINSFSAIGATAIGAIQIGVFNPAPMAVSLSPNIGYAGQTLNIIFSGTGFISGVTSVNSAAGITINSTTVNNDSTLTLNVSVGSTALVGTRQFAITNSSPLGGISDSLPFQIQGNAVASFFSNHPTIACYTTGSVDFNDYSTGGSSYLWDFGAGASPATATGFGPYTVTYSSTGLKTIKLIVFSPVGNDTLTKVNYINVTGAVPAIAASITGPLSVCSYGTSNVTYATPLVTGITSYNWVVPTGVTIVSGQGTSHLTVTFSGTFSSGSISVSESTGCGSSAARSITVNRTSAMPGAITGPALGCGLTSANYSIAAVSGAANYTWTLPAGITSTLGTSPIITTAVSIPVSIAAGFISGSISVTSNNACGSSGTRSLALSTTPATPGAISGPALTCGITTTNYSVTAVTGASNYTWTLPAGVTSTLGASPVTTTTPGISVSVGPTFITGTLSVTANNSCHSSAARTLVLNSKPGTPGVITGPVLLCGLTTGNYSVTAVTGATSYTWTLPAGITSTLGASPVTTATPSISVSIASTSVTGNISVTANNACYSSAARVLAVSNVPATPGVIAGPAMICGLTSGSYSVAAVAGASSYTWTLPTGVTSTLGVSPVTTASPNINLTIAGTFAAGSISLKANNACHSSVARVLALTNKPATPGVISGPASICSLTSATYSIAAIVGATGYTWTVPVGVTITSGQGTNTITVSIITNAASGTLRVVSTNACSSSAAKTLALVGCHSFVAMDTDNSTSSKTIETVLYPNPSPGNFNIEYNSDITSKLIIEMYDMQGRKIFSKEEAVAEGQNTFNYNEEGIEKGIYLIKIVDEGNSIIETKTFIIQ